MAQTSALFDLIHTSLSSYHQARSYKPKAASSNTQNSNSQEESPISKLKQVYDVYKKADSAYAKINGGEGFGDKFSFNDAVNSVNNYFSGTESAAPAFAGGSSEGLAASGGGYGTDFAALGSSSLGFESGAAGAGMFGEGAGAAGGAAGGFSSFAGPIGFFLFMFSKGAEVHQGRQQNARQYQSDQQTLGFQTIQADMAAGRYKNDAVYDVEGNEVSSSSAGKPYTASDPRYSLDNAISAKAINELNKSQGKPEITAPTQPVVPTSGKVNTGDSVGDALFGNGGNGGIGTSGSGLFGFLGSKRSGGAAGGLGGLMGGLGSMGGGDPLSGLMGGGAKAPAEDTSTDTQVSAAQYKHAQLMSKYPKLDFGAGTETQFQNWYSNWAKLSGINPNPDDPGHKYDYRRAFHESVTPIIDQNDGRYHWPSVSPSGAPLKSFDHPTMWKEDFMQATRENPDEFQGKWDSMLDRTQGLY